MQAEHHIDELIVDLSFTTSRLARNEKARLATWLSDDLLPELEQLFTRFSPGKQILRFETLQFDFGNLDGRNYQQHIREQLLAQFVQLLQSHVIALPSSDSRQSLSTQAEQHSQAALTQMLAYLASGQIRAHHDSETTSVIESRTALRIHELLLEQVLAQHNIADLLRQFPDQKMLVQRLLQQFSEQQRLELLRQLVPQHTETVVALLDLIQFSADKPYPHFSVNNAELNTVNNELLRAKIWQELILCGLEDELVAGSAWLDKLVNRIATALTVTKEQLQQYLLEIELPGSTAGNSVIKLQQQIAQAAVGGYQADASYPGGERHSTEDKLSQQQHPDHLRQLIATAFVRGDASGLLELWSELITRESQLISAASAHYLASAEIRQQVTQNFPLAMHADIVALLAPSLKAIFLQLQQKVRHLINSLNELSFSKTNNTTQATTLSVEQLQRQLWEIVVGLILKDKRDSSNIDYRATENTFVIALTNRYAQLNSIEPQLLQQQWLALLNNENLATSLAESLYNKEEASKVIISPQDIQGEATDSKQTKKIEQKYPEQVTQADHLPAIPMGKHEFSDSNKNSPIDQKLPVLDQGSLNSISDHQLFDLCLRLKSGALLWEELPQSLDLLRRLISSYIRLGHSATAENCADFVHAIDNQAQALQPIATQSIANFYTAVLQALIADKLVDLEEIASSINNKNIAVSKTNITSVIVAEIESDNGVAQSQHSSINKIISETPLDAIAIQLQQGKIKLESLSLDREQFAQLIDIYITTNNVIAKDLQADLLVAIHQYVSEISYTTNYYQKVLQQLIDKKDLDLSAIDEQLSKREQLTKDEQLIKYEQLTKDAPEIKTLSPRLMSEPEYKSDSGPAKKTVWPASVSKAYISELDTHPISIAQATVPSVSVVDASQTSPISVFNTKEIVQLLLAKPESITSLQQLNLNNTQWQDLVTELVQTLNPNLVALDNEFLQAINSLSRKAVNTEIYYRLVTRALLEQQSIDLEEFATAVTDTTLQPIIRQHRQDQNTKPTGDNPVDNENPSAALIVAAANQTESVINYSQLTGSDESLHKPAIPLAQLLAVEQQLNREQLLALQQHINSLFNNPNSTLLAEWCQLLTHAKHSQRLVNEVPAHLLHKIVMRLRPDGYPWIDSVVKTVMEALALLVADINSLMIKQVKWQFIFNYLFATDNSHSTKSQNTAHATELSSVLCEQLALALGMDDVQRLINLTQRRIALLNPPVQQKPSMRLQDITAFATHQKDGSAPQWDAGLHIDNAGQVLAAPYLPRLFSMLNLMNDGKFIDFEAADRAIHLLQFMVTGNSKAPEYDLVLNKILCGVGTSVPVSAGIEVTEQEQTVIEQLLTSMIQHWKVLGSTSIAGLRETFLHRQGWLILEEDCWRLKVKEQTFDMLIDHLPWSISMIKHRWMDKPVRVSWRNDS